MLDDIALQVGMKRNGGREEVEQNGHQLPARPQAVPVSEHTPQDNRKRGEFVSLSIKQNGHIGKNIITQHRIKTLKFVTNTG